MSENSLEAYVKQGLIKIESNPDTMKLINTLPQRPHYMVDADHNVIITFDLMEWAHWFEDQKPGLRRVGHDTIGDFKVSTVFLALDHAFGGGEPVLFETMVFGPDESAAIDENGESVSNDYTVRYHTWAEAEAGHEKIVKLLHNNVVDG